MWSSEEKTHRNLGSVETTASPAPKGTPVIALGKRLWFYPEGLEIIAQEPPTEVRPALTIQTDSPVVVTSIDEETPLGCVKCKDNPVIIGDIKGRFEVNSP